MKSPKFERSVRPMSVEASNDYALSTRRAVRMARRMVEVQGLNGHDDETSAAIIEQRYGIGLWQLLHLAKGRAKTCDLTLYGRLRAAYIDLCEKQVSKLQHEIAIEKATGDDDLEDLEREARALAAKIQARKAALK